VEGATHLSRFVISYNIPKREGLWICSMNILVDGYRAPSNFLLKGIKGSITLRKPMTIQQHQKSHLTLSRSLKVEFFHLLGWKIGFPSPQIIALPIQIRCWSTICTYRDIRLWCFCSYNVVENEAHFVLECPLYSFIKYKLLMWFNLLSSRLFGKLIPNHYVCAFWNVVGWFSLTKQRLLREWWFLVTSFNVVF
jgi:hypothetical protein